MRPVRASPFCPRRHPERTTRRCPSSPQGRAIPPAMDRIRTMVDATPDSRNRAVDLYRAIALLFVVLGHWLAAAVWVEPDGTLRFNTILAVADWTHWLTWIVQVMPVFF